MILESKPSEIKTSKNFTELEFGIKAQDMGLVLEILRSKMYRNPIAAICREVASNSRDANREAENNVPIEIGICNSKLLASEATIYFKDFGPGISPDRMADVFVNYGASTKRETNIYTGGFGLGAKTPFSYADNFSIETIVEGTKYTYIAAIEEGKKGKIYLIDSQLCAEHSGTTIIVPIKENDVEKFENAVTHATCFWDMKPVYKNFKYKSDFKYDVLFEDENFIITNHERSFGFTYGLILDGILYEIDQNIMKFAQRDIYSKMVIFKFNVGDLTVSANREALQYDTKTIETLNERNKILLDLASDKWQLQLDACPTWLHASLYYRSKTDNIYFKILSSQNEANNLKKSFKGERLWDSLEFQTIQFYNCTNETYNISREKISSLNNDFITKPIFFLDETSTFSTARDMTIFKNAKSFIGIKINNNNLFRFSKMSFKEKKSFAKTMRLFLNDKKFMDDHGFKYMNYSTVERTKVAYTSTGSERAERPSESVRVMKYDLNGDGYYNQTGHRRWNRTWVPYKGEYTYISTGSPLDKNTFCYVLVDDIRQVSTSSENMTLLKFAMKLKLIAPFTIIYANKNRGKELANMLDSFEDKCKLLTDDIIAQIIDHDQQHQLIERYGWIPSISFKSIRFQTIATYLKSISKVENKINVPESIVEKFKGLSKLHATMIELSKLNSFFPMLAHVSYKHEHVKIVTEYVNLVESDLMNKNEIQ